MPASWAKPRRWAAPSRTSGSRRLRSRSKKRSDSARRERDQQIAWRSGGDARSGSGCWRRPRSSASCPAPPTPAGRARVTVRQLLVGALRRGSRPPPTAASAAASDGRRARVSSRVTATKNGGSAGRAVARARHRRAAPPGSTGTGSTRALPDGRSDTTRKVTRSVRPEHASSRRPAPYRTGSSAGRPVCSVAAAIAARAASSSSVVGLQRDGHDRRRPHVAGHPLVVVDQLGQAGRSGGPSGMSRCVRPASCTRIGACGAEPCSRPSVTPE